MKNSSFKFYIPILLVLFGYLIYPLPEATLLNAGIENTHHDFRGASWSNGELCRPCHIPHNSNTEVPNSPLWSHEVTVATYQVYSTPTMDAFPGQPNGRSKLCLSCHDGTVAVENHSGNSSGTWFLSSERIGTSLTNDHPISFNYNSALAQADGELYDPSTTPSGLGGTIQQDFLADGERMECSTCHDVHVARKTNEGCSGCHFVHGQTTKTLSIRIDNSNSALCLTCHKK